MREQLKKVHGEGDAMDIYLKVKAEGNWVEFLNTYIGDEDYTVARNALWSLTKATNNELAVFYPILNSLIDHAMTTNNSSVRRLTLNIIERQKIKEEDLRTDFLDFCLEQMQRPDGLPGIQSLCMKLAFRMCCFYPELKEELKHILLDMDMEYYKPAVISIRKKILHSLSA